MIQGRFTCLLAVALLGGASLQPPRAGASLLNFPSLNVTVALAINDRCAQPIDTVLATDSSMLDADPLEQRLNFELALGDSSLHLAAIRNLSSSATLEVERPERPAPVDVKTVDDSITFDPAGIDSTWLHVRDTRAASSVSSPFSRITFDAGDRGLRLLGPQYEGARDLTLPSVYRWQLAPRISLNQDFHFMHDPLGPERDFEDSWATGFRVQIRF